MHGSACKPYIFRSCNICFSMLCVLVEILSHASAKKEDKKAYGFLISHFYGSLSNDIMAMNGLNCTGTIFSLLFHAGKSPHSARQIARRQSSAQRFLAMKESTKERRGGIWTTVLEATVVNGGGLAPNCPNTETHSESWLQDSKTAVWVNKAGISRHEGAERPFRSKTPCLGDELGRYVAHASLAKDT